MGLALLTVMAAAAAPAAAHGPASHQLAQRHVLTNSDNGQPVAVRLGDDIEVRLTSYREDGLTYTWSTPRSSAAKVLRRTAGGATPNGSASAVFHQDYAGAATISAHRHCQPSPGHACPLIVSSWRVRVTGN
ncbi:hypothetical protein AB0K89_22505 [Streptomyces cinnamoneus]|uniref:hypothetical protein n=1 Tax=Streptomyces cinnamoneus TaxID=53446 RepID=UPI00341CAA99